MNDSSEHLTFYNVTVHDFWLTSMCRFVEDMDSAEYTYIFS